MIGKFALSSGQKRSGRSLLSCGGGQVALRPCVRQKSRPIAQPANLPPEPGNNSIREIATPAKQCRHSNELLQPDASSLP